MTADGEKPGSSHARALRWVLVWRLPGCEAPFTWDRAYELRVRRSRVICCVVYYCGKPCQKVHSLPLPGPGPVH